MRTRQMFLWSAATILAAACVVASTAASGLARQQLNVAELLQTTLTDFRKTDNRAVENVCDRILASLAALPALDESQLRQALTAFELRSRARYAQRNFVGAREDFKAILVRSPAHVYGSLTVVETGSNVNPNSAGVFEEVRKETVGRLVLNIVPEGAEVRVDDVVVPPGQRAGGQPLARAGGSYKVSAQVAGHRRREEIVVVAAGAETIVTWTLERVTSVFEVMTSPPGVEVFVDGQRRGVTPPGPPPARYSGAPDVVALGREASGVLPIPDLPTRELRFEFKLDCYTPETRTRPVERAGDYYVTQVLRRASARLRVGGNGGLVYIDGELKGPVPYEQDLCPQPQPQVVEVRSARGRQVHRVMPVAGVPIDITADPKPAIAILNQAGLPETLRMDLRREVENALASAAGATFFAVADAEAQAAMKAEGLTAGWLSYDLDGKPVSTEARAMTASARLDLSRRLASRLEVQGIAEINVPDAQLDPRSLLLTYLAAGSNVPETLQIKLTDPASERRAAAVFRPGDPIARIAAGVHVADVAGVAGAVVLQQIWDLTGGVQLQTGDVIQTAAGRTVADGSAFEALVAGVKPGDPIPLQVRRADRVLPVQLTPQNFPNVVGFYDETLPVNKLLLDFRLALLDAVSPRDRAIAGLNLAVVLMRAGNWAEARIELEKLELEKVSLPDLKGGQGISRGTAQYYLGLCLDALERPADANRAFEAARDSPGALLTADGPLVRPLAEEKLKDPSRRQR